MLIPGPETQIQQKPTRDQLQQNLLEQKGKNSKMMSRTASEFFQEKFGHQSAKELVVRDQKNTDDYTESKTNNVKKRVS